MLLIAFSAVTMNAQSIEGAWNTGKENTVIVIKKVGSSYVGTTLSSDNAQVKKGKKLIKDVKASGKVWKGKLYAPKKKKWMDATFAPKGDKLKITIKSGMMSKTIEWKKAK